jgi:hypothetical protein
LPEPERELEPELELPLLPWLPELLEPELLEPVRLDPLLPDWLPLWLPRELAPTSESSRLPLLP